MLRTSLNCFAHVEHLYSTIGSSRDGKYFLNIVIFKYMRNYRTMVVFQRKRDNHWKGQCLFLFKRWLSKATLQSNRKDRRTVYVEQSRGVPIPESSGTCVSFPIQSNERNESRFNSSDSFSRFVWIGFKLIRFHLVIQLSRENVLYIAIQNGDSYESTKRIAIQDYDLYQSAGWNSDSNSRLKLLELLIAIYCPDTNKSCSEFVPPMQFLIRLTIYTIHTPSMPLHAHNEPRPPSIIVWFHIGVWHMY